MERTVSSQRESLRAVVRESFVTGVAVLVPALVTVFVLLFVFNAIYRYVTLLSGYIPATLSVVLVPGVLAVSARTLLELLVPVVFVVGTFWLGFVVKRWHYGERAVDYFDYVITRIPGVGSIYESFRQMSDVVLDGDEESFREVKLVEFPHEDSYTLGFVTTETPEPLAAPTDHDELVTMFLPMAPNPVMGGHLVHLPTERVMDVDLTVEEGIQTIVTSGVALANGRSREGLSAETLRELAASELADYRESRDRPAEDVVDRTERYERDADPRFAERPADIVDHERSESGSGADGTQPARQAGRPSNDSDRTEGRPAEHADRPPEARESTEGRPAEGDDAGGEPEGDDTGTDTVADDRRDA